MFAVFHLKKEILPVIKKNPICNLTSGYISWLTAKAANKTREQFVCQQQGKTSILKGKHYTSASSYLPKSGFQPYHTAGLVKSYIQLHSLLSKENPK